MHDKMHTITIVVVLALSLYSMQAFQVEELTDRTFNHTVTESETAVVIFYTPKQCEFCRKLMPRFLEAASRLVDFEQPISFFKVDCSDEGKDTCDEQMVHDVPVVDVFKHGKYVREIKETKTNIMVQLIKKIARRGSIRVDTPEELNELLEQNLCMVMGFFEDDSELRQAYFQVSEKLMDRYTFADTSSPELMDLYQLTNNIIVLRLPQMKNEFEDRKLIYTGDTNPTNVEEFVTRNYYGLVGVRHRKNKRNFKPPYVLIFCPESDDEALIFWRNNIYSIAVHFNNVTFAVSNVTKDLKSYGIERLVDNVAVVAKDTKKQKYVMVEDYTHEVFEAFVSDFINGKLIPFLKSQPIPEDSGRLVKEVVAKSFNTVVLENDRDTFIAFYAPWCPHCQRLEQQYNNLAKALKDEAIDVARMDGTSNDVPLPFEVLSFPVAYLVPKDNKSHPIRYNGGKNMDEVIKFIARHATEELKGWDRNGKKKPAPKTEL